MYFIKYMSTTSYLICRKCKDASPSYDGSQHVYGNMAVSSLQLLLHSSSAFGKYLKTSTVYNISQYAICFKCQIIALFFKLINKNSIENSALK